MLTKIKVTTNKFTSWYKKHNNCISKVVKVAISFTIIVLGFYLNKTYYEDISVEFYPFVSKDEPYSNNIVDEVNLDKEPNKVVLVSSLEIPMTIEILKFESMEKDNSPKFKSTGIKKSLEPGDVFKISYLESENIPNYELKASTGYGDGNISLKYNGRYGNINKTKIKSERKLIPYFIDKVLN
ncbi:TPA: hypothetical protein ACWWET_000745 [Enterococcus faecalis]|uniref:hypothetical protein n=1 Tax=Enterococcus faecalis TaxID=1351 RepID=UPI00032FDA71|nr:hypothetical protein [Enterococcus faecalis]EOL89158.1 hypothetical protein WM3_02565 [Enterococcus faecalis EnGen0366]MEB7789985.1 hypothetical protein [Enterococcus faecalis]MEB7807543.1 hypothetical protein [Enterococcus faecalis]NRC97231.1 hypothetical protein [Enterococcus faecalis]NSS08318.1 hypothetical protein [Enterococcus faecalis]